MKKTLQDFISQIFAKKNADPVLAAIDSTSKTSIWGRILETVAFVIFIFQESANLHSTEIDDRILNQKVPNTLWYRSLAKSFQYLFDLIPESGQFDNGAATDEHIEASKVIKYAAVDRAEQSSTLIMKIATEENGEIAPVSTDILLAFTNYIKRTQAAGEMISIYNYEPDLLNLDIEIYINPLVLNLTGMNRDGVYPVKIALENYMRNLPFNGELLYHKLIDVIQSVDGVETVKVNKMESKEINPTLLTYGLYQPIDVAKIPFSGYFKIVTFDSIIYKIR